MVAAIDHMVLRDGDWKQSCRPEFPIQAANEQGHLVADEALQSLIDGATRNCVDGPGGTFEAA